MSSSAAPEEDHKSVPEDMQKMIEQSIEFENQLKAQILENTPPISPKLPMDVFIKEYQDNKFYDAFVILKNTYPHVRRLRRDGNCFYRAYLLQLLQHLYAHREAPIFKQTVDRIDQSKKFLLEAGYQSLVTQDFIQVTLDALKKLKQIKPADIENHLITLLGSKDESPYMIMYLRYIAAGYLKQNAILYEGFFEGETMEQFCAREVESLDVEADQLQIIALTNYFKHLGVEISTVAAGGACHINQIPEGGDVEYCVRVLFTPGHYDALYKE